MSKATIRQEHKAYRGRAHIVGDRQPPKTGPAQEGPKVKKVKVKKADKSE
jgi:hypothetical protein